MILRKLFFNMIKFKEIKQYYVHTFYLFYRAGGFKSRNIARIYSFLIYLLRNVSGPCAHYRSKLNGMGDKTIELLS